ncbi:hypothetical protein NDU88_007979 [Pleurodeles waltl]|uniref:Uncharacterized protein n=1 Tax=Pleurodeles waltl TaxID=8319 RepID=A0AAV7RSH1_PLEWA|nr:hypothetical protein NDU88_007979 [Pleurodeles waltl]
MAILSLSACSAVTGCMRLLPPRLLSTACGSLVIDSSLGVASDYLSSPTLGDLLTIPLARGRDYEQATNYACVTCAVSLVVLLLHYRNRCVLRGKKAAVIQLLTILEDYSLRLMGGTYVEDPPLYFAT